MASSPQTSLRTAAAVVVATLALHLVLIQPNHPGAMTFGALTLFPLELPVLICGLLLIGATPWAVWVRSTLVVVLLLIALLKTADVVMFTALSRGFNPVTDMPLIESGVDLAVRTMGVLLALATAAAAALGLGLAAGGLWWATGVFAGLSLRVPLKPAIGAVFAAFLLTAVAQIGQVMAGWTLPLKPPGAAFTARIGAERVVMVRQTLADLKAFEAAAAQDAYAGQANLLDTIDRDLLLIFIESYGRTSFSTERYTTSHLETLETAETRLAELGIASRSGFLTAPTRGGQSWLIHATLSNGLWVADQASYGAVLSCSRNKLFHLAAAAGFRTAAVMPQITLEWPESDTMGFETVLAAKDLGYAGAPFNWVTMPDQFTLSAMHRLLRQGSADRYLFAQIALGSSHAPWMPVPELFDWSDGGDGRIFNAMAPAGDPPKVVWQDRDRVRDQYRLAIDYALTIVIDYIARQADRPPLVIVVGDHQPAPFVALDERDHVPMHVVGPEHLVAKSERWGLVEGLVPAPDASARPMNELRNLILETFSTEGAADSEGATVSAGPQ